MTKQHVSPVSRINFDAVDVRDIERILRTGAVDSLTAPERRYYELMEVVRGFRARMMLPGGDKVVTKAAIIKLLKAPPYGLTDWTARRVYADAINFFYSVDDIRPRAWANLYADKLEKWADLAAATGRLKDAKSFIAEAAKLRGCYDPVETEIPHEVLDAAPVVIYTTDPSSMGAPKADRKQLGALIDSIPDIPEASLKRIKEDAGLQPRNLLERILSDAKEFGDEDS